MTASPPVVRKKEHLEALQNQFKDLAIEVILKEDLLCEGVEFAANSRLTGLRDPWRSLALEGGPYKLFRTLVRPPIRSGSPYLVELDPMDDRPVLKDRSTGSTLAYVREYPMEPAYLSRQFPGGVSMGEVVGPDGEVVVSEVCALGGAASCPVCSGQGVFRKRTSSGVETAVHVRNPEAVGQAAFDAYALEDWPHQEGPLRISLDAGRRPSTYEGVPEAQFFMSYVQALHRRLHAVWLLMLTMAPKGWDTETALRDAGVSVRTAPLGVWDPQLFEALYPELARYMPRDQWLRWFAEAPYTYTGSAVFADMDIGAELSGGRFNSQSEALASTRSAFGFLISHGALPRLRHWEGSTAPVEYFLEVNRAWYEIWVQTQANEPHGYIMGIGRNRWPFSANWEVGRGGPPEYAREWDKEKLGEPGYRVPEQPRG